jgi:hypothetical protein
VEEITRTPHWIVTLEGRIVRAVRTSVPFANESELRASMGTLQQPTGHDRSKLGLLVDLRDGPFRNDDSFETALARYRVELFSGWAGVATILRTAVGRLQVTRLAREDRREMQIFNDEASALSYLAAKLA